MRVRRAAHSTFGQLAERLGGAYDATAMSPLCHRYAACDALVDGPRPLSSDCLKMFASLRLSRTAAPLIAHAIRQGLRGTWRLLIVAWAIAPSAVNAAPALDVVAIDALVQREMAERNVPGLAVGIVYRGELVYAKGHGLADLENDVPVTPESVFAIASVSKPVLALGVARLVDQGKLSWSDPIAKHLPESPPHWRAITLAHLANHTSGIVRESPAFDGARVQSEADLLAATYPVPLDFATGTKMQYCNICYFALAEVISRVSGMPWPAYMDKTMFQPAGMTSTRTTSVEPLVPRRAASYSWSNGRQQQVPEYKAVRPSGAFLSTVTDMARLEAALHAGRVVSDATRRVMETPALLADGATGKMNPASSGYGLGWEIGELDGRRRLSHGGSLAGFRTIYARYPDQGWAVIILANGTEARRIALEFAIARLLPKP